MSQDVQFTCPKCRQWLEAPPEMVGLFVECPTCTEIIKVPSESMMPVPSSSHKPPPAPDAKGTTMRIELPPNLGVPQPPRRRFVIRRKD